MEILLDTHAIIWFFDNDSRLSKLAVEAFYELDNTIFVSIASIWEIGIKLSTGKLALTHGIDGFIEAINDNEFRLLEVSPDHIKTITELPFIHRDPFDRMLIAQAKVEGMHLMTADDNIIKYDIKHIW
ncbi:MAG: type II toxin-antitoxin system VapC family toxin [Oscillospiraceae bacterium]|nr:type II toxin-antitoxin system VapC family toxin [Oscillospiraceae bacterium]